MITTQIVLNKSRDKTLVFIHGFYANAGFWLPYLPYFKEYKIVLLNINYSVLLNSNKQIAVITENISALRFDDGVVAVISHSLGTIFSNFINDHSKYVFFDICPVAYSNRSDTNGFVNDILLRVGETKKNIRNNLLLVDLLIYKSREFILDNRLLFIPDSDQYFTYQKTSNSEFIFKGDHFEITNAISLINNMLKV
ncbi:MAG: hypothetical protein HQ490_05310 [Lutibacter sp.]|nr:hypothetical protein [Lutibacter sp.]